MSPLSNVAFGSILGFKGLPNHYTTLYQVAAKEEWTYSDFLENAFKKVVSPEKIAGFPLLKTLEEYDFEFAQGVPKKQIEETSKLTFLRRSRRLISLSLESSQKEGRYKQVHQSFISPLTTSSYLIELKL